MTREIFCFAALYVLEALIAWRYDGYIYPKARSDRFVLFGFSFGYCILFLISFYNSVAGNVAAFFAVNVSLLMLNYSCSIKTALLQGAFLTFVMSITEVLVNLLLTAILEDYNAYTYNFAAMVTLVVLSKLLYLFVANMAAKLFKPHKIPLEEPSTVILLGGMPVVSSFIVITVIYIGATSGFTSVTEILIAISMLTLLLVNISVLIVYDRFQALAEDNMALNISKVRDEADTDYYQMLQEQYEDQQILIHDMKKHLSTINDLLREENPASVEEYITQLEGMPSLKRKVRLCKNPLLNIILVRYSEYCEAKGIEFICNVRSQNFDFMDPVSMTALFGNLLSNAIEAAEESQEKIVEFSAANSTVKNCLVISVINSCDISPSTDTYGNLKTRKADTQQHGYGTKSIGRVVTKYNGLAQSDYDEKAKRFHFVVRFPHCSGVIKQKDC